MYAFTFYNMFFLKKSFISRDGFKDLNPDEVNSLTPYSRSIYESSHASYHTLCTILRYLENPAIKDLQIFIQKLVS